MTRTCASSPRPPNSSAFLRESARIEWGEPFLDALHDKYEGRIHSVVSLTGAPPPPALADPSAVYVAEASDPDKVREECAHVTSLDLSRSLLSSWDELTRITDELVLETLILHHTRLAPPTRPFSLATLRDLQMDATGVSWNEVRCTAHQIVKLGRHMPQLVSLRLAHNGLATLGETPTGTFQALVTLNLQRNALGDFAGIVKSLHTLPRLAHLVLSDNAIAYIPPLDTQFPALHSISLQGNPIRDWASLEALETQLVAPWSLQLGHSTIAPDERTLRWMAIGRLGTLGTLEHTPISAQERVDAERYYLAHAPQDHAALRYQTLCKVHGAPTQAQAPPTLRVKLVEIGVVCSDHVPTSDEGALWLDAAPVHASLLRTMPLRLARRRICTAAHIPPSGELYAVLRAETGAVVVPLDEEAGTLDDYGVQENDVIVVVR